MKRNLFEILRAGAVFVLCLTVLLSLVPFSFPAKAFSGSVEGLADEVIRHKVNTCGAADVSELVNSVFAAESGDENDWFVYSLIRYEAGENFSVYEKALEKRAKQGDSTNPVIRQKEALTLTALGCKDKVVNDILEATTGKLGIMSYIFSLHLLNAGVKSESFPVKSVTDTILSKVLPDGGWAITGKASDVDVTAMAVQALAPRYSDTRVKAVIDKAITLLSREMTESGNYISYGVENCESAAQVVIALCCLGIDCEKDPRFIRNGRTLLDTLLSYRCSDGGYRHTSDTGENGNAAVQALSAYASLSLLRSGKGSFFPVKNSVPASEPKPTQPPKKEKPTQPTTKSTAEEKKPAQAPAATRSQQTPGKKRSEGSSIFTGLFGKKDSGKTARGTTATEPVTESSAANAAEPSLNETSEAAKQTFEGTETTPSPTFTDSSQATTPTTAETTTQLSTVPSTKIQDMPTTEGKKKSKKTETTEATVSEYADTESETSTEPSAESPLFSEEASCALSGSPESTVVSREESKKEKGSELRPIIAVVILSVATAFLLILYSRKKLGRLTVVCILVIALLAVLLTFTLDIQSVKGFSSDGVKDSGEFTVTLSIRCDTAVGKSPSAPADGCILPRSTFYADSGDTVYDILLQAAKEYSIQIENASQTLNDTSAAYINGINYLYEFDCGELSGWVFRLNGSSSSVGCGACRVNAGDEIEFLYTCELGEDLKVSIDQ